MTQHSIVPILTTGVASIVPQGKIKPVEQEVRHAVPVQVRRVVLDEVPAACSVRKGRVLDPIRVYEGRYYRVMPVGLHTIDTYLHEALAKENPATCPTWRKDECAWKKDVPTLAEIPVRKVVDDGWNSAALRAQSMADRWLILGGNILQEIPKPCLRIRFDPHAFVDKEIRTETVADRMPTRRLSVRFPITDELATLKLAQAVFDRVYGRAGKRPMQALHPVRIERPDLMPTIGVAEFAEDLLGAINDQSEKGMLFGMDAGRLAALAELKGMLETGLDGDGLRQALDLFLAATKGMAGDEDHSASPRSKSADVARMLFANRLAVLTPTPATVGRNFAR